MDTFANANEINQYIDYLTDQVFSILPVFEETGYSESLQKKICNMSAKLDGFFRLYHFTSPYAMDILSLMAELEVVREHKRIRSCVLKTCSLLSQLKVVDEV